MQDVITNYRVGGMDLSTGSLESSIKTMLKYAMFPVKTGADYVTVSTFLLRKSR